jgi:hypothetical protein
MAEKALDQNSSGGKSLPDWKRERIEMTKLVWKNVLDPILTFCELVRGYDSRGHENIDLTPQEITAVLRLLVLGSYTEPKFYVTSGDSLHHISGEVLEELLKNWDSGE